MEARSASVSIPGVEGCLTERLPSAGGVLAAFTRRAEAGLSIGGGEGITWWACATALCASDGEGRVELVRCDGDGPLEFGSLDDLAFLGFLPAVLDDGGGVLRGES